MPEWISGRNPVYELLRANRRTVHALRIAQGARPKGRLSTILELAEARGLAPEVVPRAQLDALGSGHQGVAVQAEGYPYALSDDIFAVVQTDPTHALVLILDLVQDPQNLATLLRSAEAVGVRGVFLPPRRSAGVTPAVVQASSGATEHLRIARSNLVQAIQTLQKLGLWVVGLENLPEAMPPDQVNLRGSLALVVGGEGQGMRRLVRESCDLILRLPMKGQIGSLNAAVAGSVALYLAWQANGFVQGD